MKKDEKFHPELCNKASHRDADSDFIFSSSSKYNVGFDPEKIEKVKKF